VGVGFAWVRIMSTGGFYESSEVGNFLRDRYKVLKADPVSKCINELFIK
jgi:hypothetical protein